jgi:hypothetical protein
MEIKSSQTTKVMPTQSQRHSTKYLQTMIQRTSRLELSSHLQKRPATAKTKFMVFITLISMSSSAAPIAFAASDLKPTAANSVTPPLPSQSPSASEFETRLVTCESASLKVSLEVDTSIRLGFRKRAHEVIYQNQTIAIAPIDGVYYNEDEGSEDWPNMAWFKLAPGLAIIRFNLDDLTGPQTTQISIGRVSEPSTCSVRKVQK